jgi:O-antigen ligase
LKRYGFFALAVLLLGTSSGSFIATFCGLILILFLHRNAGVLILVAGLLLVILIIGVDWAPVWDFVFYGKSERAISTLHGRLPMWQRLLELVYENIFLGTGFGVFMRSADLATAGHPHNSLISVLMGTGILGGIPVVIFFFRLLREFLKTTGRKLPGAIGCTAAISTGLINSLASPFVLDKWDESTLVFACLIALFILFVVSSQNLRDK